MQVLCRCSNGGSSGGGGALLDRLRSHPVQESTPEEAEGAATPRTSSSTDSSASGSPTDSPSGSPGRQQSQPQAADGRSSGGVRIPALRAGQQPNGSPIGQLNGSASGRPSPFEQNQSPAGSGSDSSSVPGSPGGHGGTQRDHSGRDPQQGTQHTATRRSSFSSGSSGGGRTPAATPCIHPEVAFPLMQPGLRPSFLSRLPSSDIFGCDGVGTVSVDFAMWGFGKGFNRTSEPQLGLARSQAAADAYGDALLLLQLEALGSAESKKRLTPDRESYGGFESRSGAAEAPLPESRAPLPISQSHPSILL